MERECTELLLWWPLRLSSSLSFLSFLSRSHSLGSKRFLSPEPPLSDSDGLHSDRTGTGDLDRALDDAVEVPKRRGDEGREKGRGRRQRGR